MAKLNVLTHIETKIQNKILKYLDMEQIMHFMCLAFLF